MHIHSLDNLRHSHDFTADSTHAEKGTMQVMFLTAAMMVVEVIAGMWYGSMALLADGWHMATHVAAFGIAVFAYRYARRHAQDQQFSFGTGKVSVLGGFASAVALAVVAMIMAVESIMRMIEPQNIRFTEAIVVAAAGLLVNLVSGLMLHRHDGHTKGHGHAHAAKHDYAHGHDHEHEHARHRDHNLHAAYIHVLADALTSVFAIVALLAGKYFGWVWLDPVMGVVGAIVIARWSYRLVHDTGHILLDGAVGERARTAVRHAIERDADNRVTDLHVWQVGPGHYSASIALITHFPQSPDHYKALLHGIPGLDHVLIEVNPCHDKNCVSPAL